MTRRALLFVAAMSGIALIAPFLAPYNPDTGYRNFLFAPPMPPRVVDDGALRARDLYLVTGCAAAGAVFIGLGTLLADMALVLVDPRRRLGVRT